LATGWGIRLCLSGVLAILGNIGKAQLKDGAWAAEGQWHISQSGSGYQGEVDLDCGLATGLGQGRPASKAAVLQDPGSSVWHHRCLHRNRACHICLNFLQLGKGTGKGTQ
jgi:hypothetical protein